MGVQDGPVWFLFDNTGDLYFGRAFEMLAVLEANFKPTTFCVPLPHCFLSLTTSRMRSIHVFPACFEGHLHNISWLMVSIPPILQAMLFLWALHPRYKAITNMLASKQEDISIATIDSIVSKKNAWISFLSLALLVNLVLSRMIN